MSKDKQAQGQTNLGIKLSGDKDCISLCQQNAIASMDIFNKTRCVCETRMPPKRPFFEKYNLFIFDLDRCR